METAQVNLIAFLGALEFALLTLVVAIGLGLRGRRLAKRVRDLERRARQAKPGREPVSAQTDVAADVQAPVEPDPSADQENSAPRETHDAHAEELDHLKQAINNQQDAMAALRAKLREHESELQGAEDVLQKLDELEKRSNELQRCLQVPEQENERLKSAWSQRHPGGTGTQPAQLNGCVAALEDENALLRSELEEIQAKIARREADAGQGEEGGGQRAGEAGLSEQKQELEVKVQELEAVLEFKDAAIQELEKQYNILESKYLAASGQKQA